MILGDIAKATGLNAATCSRILTTLMSEGYVEQDGRRKGYRIGPMAYVLTAHGPYRKDLLACAAPVVRELAETTRETALVAILQQNKRYTLCQTDGGQDVQVRTDVILRENLFPTVTGRILLAHLTEAALDDFLAAVGLPDAESWPEATTKVKLLKQLEAIRTQDYVISENPKQTIGVAFPIWNGETVVAALGLYLPLTRFNGDHENVIIREMKAAALKIGERLSQMHNKEIRNV